MRKYQQGEVVQLKSGGPKMTVKKTTPKKLVCIWFADDYTFMSQDFKPEFLKPASANG